VTRTIGMIGDYDKFAIEYGYKPIPGAGSAEAESHSWIDTLRSR